MKSQPGDCQPAQTPADTARADLRRPGTPLRVPAGWPQRRGKTETVLQLAELSTAIAST